MKKKLRIIFIVVLVGILAYSVWQLRSIDREYSEGDAIYEEARKYVLTDEELGDDQVENIHNPYADLGIYMNLGPLQEENPDVLGWLLIPDTPVDYPLVQGSNNDKYLTYAYNGVWSSLGSIFLDYRDTPDFSDLHSIIYGHNTKNNSMFGSLRKYRDQSYFDEHPKFYILVENGYLVYEIFSAHKTDTLSEVYQTDSAVPAEHEAFLEYAVAASGVETGVAVSPEDKIITLSTCTSVSINERFVVHGRLAEDHREAPDAAERPEAAETAETAGTAEAPAAEENPAASGGQL